MKRVLFEVVHNFDWLGTVNVSFGLSSKFTPYLIPLTNLEDIQIFLITQCLYTVTSITIMPQQCLKYLNKVVTKLNRMHIYV